MAQSHQLALLVDYPCDCGDCYDCNEANRSLEDYECAYCGMLTHFECECFD
jgi:hypothetical protein